ncbi:MAG: hypothetical protein K0R51_2452 [Cytophagaceae bacterium]|jgi:hypothetical protein|nr:hypothetical protein [Cytophagaceae bacterium]
MINLFLKAKHWQLFLLTFGIPMILQFAMMVILFTSMHSGSQPDPAYFIAVLPLIMLLFIAVFFGWFWSIAIGLQSKVPQDVKMKVTKFKIFFFIPLVYMVFFLTFALFSFSGGAPNPSIIFAIVPLHLFSMFCIFYSLYFVAKTIRTVELQRAVSFSDFAGEFFMIWFYPIGIWIIQPRLNKIVGE